MPLRQSNANEPARQETTGQTKSPIHWSWWTIVMPVLLAWNVRFLLPAGGGQKPLSCSAFRSALTTGNAAIVDLKGRPIRGTPHDAPSVGGAVTVLGPAPAISGSAASMGPPR
ncbi:MAG: hypothetical protein ACYC65_08405 [Candidatus Limnocylindrales bacterium]